MEGTCTVTVSVPTYTEDEGSYSGAAIKVGDTWWAPVNCGYDATNYPYGKLYQWGRKDGQGYEGSDATYPSGDNLVNAQTNSPEAAKFYYGYSNWYNGTTPTANSLWGATKTDYDPCPNGWRVPTQTELSTLMGSHTSGSMQTGTHGSTTDLNGKWFDGSTTSEPTSGIFLPAAGRLLYFNGTCHDRGTNGNYWSSSYRSSVESQHLGFYNNYTSVSYYDKSDGYSVRCVKQ